MGIQLQVELDEVEVLRDRLDALQRQLVRGLQTLQCVHQTDFLHGRGLADGVGEEAVEDLEGKGEEVVETHLSIQLLEEMVNRRYRLKGMDYEGLP